MNKFKNGDRVDHGVCDTRYAYSTFLSSKTCCELNFPRVGTEGQAEVFSYESHRVNNMKTQQGRKTKAEDNTTFTTTTFLSLDKINVSQ